MKAIVKSAAGPGHVGLRDDWRAPTPRAGWVVGRVLACGICGTDLHIMHGDFATRPPVVMGHEYVLEVTELGDGVEGWAIGDRAVCEQHVHACGECDACRRGLIHLCLSKRPPGGGIDGGFAEQIELPARLLHRVPEGLPDLSAVVVEPLAICVTGVDRGAVSPGEVAVVIGPGPVGLLTALTLRAAGLEVLLIGRPSSRQRLELAQSLGIETALDDGEQAEPWIQARSTRGGADVVFEASGSEAGLNRAVGLTRRAGRVVCLGIVGAETVAFVADEAMRRSLDIRFSVSSEYSSWDRALMLLASGRIDPAPLVRVYPLDEWETAFEDIVARRVVKAVLQP